MEFGYGYLEYKEYMWLGGNLDITPFNILEFESRRRIDIRTQNRLKDAKCDEIPQEVKMCEYALINMAKRYYEQENNVSASGKNIASENIDGYSVSYNNITLDKVKEIMDSKKAEVDDILNTYLIGVIYNNEHIAYLGVK